MAKVTPDNFKAQIQAILDEYEGEVNENLGQIVDKAGQKAAQLLRNTSPVDTHGKKPGAYAKGWKVEKSAKTHRQLHHSATVYNKYPGLPHLLENGHALRQGGRSPAIVHIKPVEDAVYDSLRLEDIT